MTHLVRQPTQKRAGRHTTARCSACWCSFAADAVDDEVDRDQSRCYGPDVVGSFSHQVEELAEYPKYQEHIGQLLPWEPHTTDQAQTWHHQA